MAFDPDYALFVAVAEAGSLSAAARALRLSPAMVSKRLQRLEQRLGVTLVHRTTRRLALTTAGERFRADLGDILGALDAAEARVTGARTAPAGPLHVSAPTSFGRLHVAPHLGRFVAACPAVELRFDLDDGFVDLFGARVDCAIRIAQTCPRPSWRTGSRPAVASSARRRPISPTSARLNRWTTCPRIACWRPMGRCRGVSSPADARRSSPNPATSAPTPAKWCANSHWAASVSRCARYGMSAMRSPRDARSRAARMGGVGRRRHLRGPPAQPAVPAAVTAFIDFLRDTIDPAAWA